MKKYISYLLILSLIILSVSCNKISSPEKQIRGIWSLSYGYGEINMVMIFEKDTVTVYSDLRDNPNGNIIINGQHYVELYDYKALYHLNEDNTQIFFTTGEVSFVYDIVNFEKNTMNLINNREVYVLATRVNTFEVQSLP